MKIGPKLDVNFLSKFPYTSIQLEDVYVMEVNSDKNKDTLFKFRSVFLQFNLVDVLREKYVIRTIQAENGVARIEINKSGEGNFNIFKDSKNSRTSFSIKLDKVYIKNLIFFYSDKSLGVDLSGNSNELRLSGQFANNRYDLDFLCKAMLWNIDHNGNKLLRTKRIRLEGVARVDKIKQEYVFEEANVRLADLSMAINGKVVNKRKGTFLDLNLRGKEMNIGSILSLVPAKFNYDLERFKSSGVFYFTGNVNGILGNGFFPLVEGNFGIKEGVISSGFGKVDLTQVNMTGDFSNGSSRSYRTTRLGIKNFHAKLGHGVINGDFFVENFSNPSISIACNANLNLFELNQFFPDDYLKFIDGWIIGKIDFKTRINSDWKIGINDFRNAIASGSFEIRDVNFELKKNPNDFRDFDGSFQFKGNELYIKDFSGFISKSDFSLNGYFRNLLPYIFLDDVALFMNATLTADRIDIDELISSIPSRNDLDTVYSLNLPSKAEIVLLLDLDELNFKKFQAKNITGNATLKERVLSMNGLNLESCGGEVFLSGSLDGRRSGLLKVQGSTKVKNVEINKLFLATDNFGQEFITANNIRGFGSLDASFSFPMNSKLDISSDMLIVETNVSIEKGELIDFSPLEKLAKFVDLNELQSIQFSKLSNHISIKDRQIVIPQMDVGNNVINIRVEGVHDFTNNVDYHFRLQLADLLAKKFEKNNGSEFEEEEEDGGKTSVYLRMKGKGSNPLFSYDFGGVRNKLKSDLMGEKGNIRKTLKGEFTKSGKDSLMKVRNSTVSKTKLKVTWDEDMGNKPNSNKPDNQNLSKEKTAPEKSDQNTRNKNQSKNDSSSEKIDVEWE
ncbi:MAG: AsmA-like C-terminal region-containing protein [Bacteroidia bacterium]|nr:AsmA-like C-terminal region-containing protein [Bacteroidia bacterium]